MSKEFWDKAWEKYEDDATSPWYCIVPSTDGSYLDIGCGNLRHVNLAQNKNLVGLDISKNALEKAKRTKRENKYNCDLIQATAQYLPFKNGSFDQISMIETLTLNGNSYEKILSEVARIAKNRFVFTATHKSFDTSFENSSKEAKEILDFMERGGIKRKF